MSADVIKSTKEWNVSICNLLTFFENMLTIRISTYTPTYWGTPFAWSDQYRHICTDRKYIWGLRTWEWEWLLMSGDFVRFIFILHVCVYTRACEWRSKITMERLISSFQYVSLRGWIQVVSLGGRNLYSAILLAWGLFFKGNENVL